MMTSGLRISLLIPRHIVQSMELNKSIQPISSQESVQRNKFKQSGARNRRIRKEKASKQKEINEPISDEKTSRKRNFTELVSGRLGEDDTNLGKIGVKSDAESAQSENNNAVMWDYISFFIEVVITFGQVEDLVNFKQLIKSKSIELGRQLSKENFELLQITYPDIFLKESPNGSDSAKAFREYFSTCWRSYVYRRRQYKKLRGQNLFAW